MARRQFSLPLCALAALTALLLTACSLTLDLSACESDRDCARNQVCGADNFCVDDDGENGCSGNDCEVQSCTETEECAEGYICAENNVCVSSSAQCQIDADCTPLFGEGGTCEEGICQGVTELTGGPCTRLDGAAGEEDAFLIGVVLQLSGVGAGFGQPMLDSIRIAMRDINGIGGVDGRKIGLVICDTEARDAQARAAAEHLVALERVQAIIGMNSSQVIDIGPTVTVPAGVLLMSPSATATTISALNDDNLIWRTAQSDEAQATALGSLINHMLLEVLPAQDITEPKVALLVRNQDRWATGLRDYLSSSLPPEISGGGSDRFTIHNFANVGAGEPEDYTGTAAALAAEDVAPDLVIVLGSADSWTLIDHIETLLDNEPLFIGGDAMKNAAAASQAKTELEGRIWGTGPRNVAETGYQPYSVFRLKFLSELNDEPNNYQFVANAFDALYVLAFAAAAEGFSGEELATGLTRLSDGENIDPHSSDAQRALNTLSSGGTINYRGASGPLNFDENGDPEPQPIALWCFENGTVPERGDIYTPGTGFTPLTCN